MSEFIYVLENPSMPGLVKIGRTDRSVSQRVSELSSHTGVPTGFILVREYSVANSVEAERKVHVRLAGYRVSDNREFFKIDADDVADIIESMLETATSRTRRDFEREDELIAKAIPIVAKQGTARPRQLEEMLGISYEEALSVVHTLRGRGLIGQGNESYLKVAPRVHVGTGKGFNFNESVCDVDEEVIHRCIEVIRTEQKASVSLFQRRLKLAYSRAARIMEELESRGIIGPSKGAEPRDILIDLDAGDFSTPVAQSPVIAPHLVVSACEHCSGKMEFDANELGDRQSVSVPCPHCGIETELSASS